MVKNLPAMQEILVRFLGWEDPLEKGMATHSSILAWRISWTEEPGGLQSMGLQAVGQVLATEYTHNVIMIIFGLFSSQDHFKSQNANGFENILLTTKFYTIKNLLYLFKGHMTE